MFSQDFINEVKSKVNLVELVSEYTAVHKAGKNIYVGRCPHPHHDDHDPSFRIWTKGFNNNKYDSWACMVCHSGKKDKKDKIYGSDCFAFYQWIEGVNWKQAVYDLCEKYSIPIPSSEFDKLYKTKAMQTRSYIKNLNFYTLQYLYSRGLTLDNVTEWSIGSQGDKIVFPLLNKYKAPIAFTKRWINAPVDCKDKYKNSATSKIFNKSSYLYGIHNINDESDEIRITEGPMDVIVAHKYGLKNVVATLGTAFTDNHIELIKEMGKTPTFIMDGDDRGIIAAEKAINKLAEAGIYSKILILPNGNDLCEISNQLKHDIEEYVQDNALTYGQYKLNNIMNRFNSKVSEIKIKCFKEAKKVLEEIPLEDERIIMKSYIQKHMGIDIDQRSD